MSCVPDTSVVTRAAPSTCTTDVPRKLLPLTVSVKPVGADATLVGLRLLIVGALAVTTVKVAALLVQLATHGDGFTTVIAGVLADATSPAGIAAVSCVGDTTVVGRFDPFSCTAAPATNPLPVTVSVKSALPAARLPGPSVAIAGVALATVTVGLVAIGGSVDADAFANHRDSHWPPAASVGGTVNVSVALVAPVVGGVLLPFMNQ